MGKVSHFPKKQHQEEVDIIQVSKDKIMVNDVECQPMDLDEFLMSLEISPEAEERFIRGLFQIIKEEIMSSWSIRKIFREVFKGR